MTPEAALNFLTIVVYLNASFSLAFLQEKYNNLNFKPTFRAILGGLFCIYLMQATQFGILPNAKQPISEEVAWVCPDAVLFIKTPRGLSSFQPKTIYKAT